MPTLDELLDAGEVVRRPGKAGVRATCTKCRRRTMMIERLSLHHIDADLPGEVYVPLVVASWTRGHVLADGSVSWTIFGARASARLHSVPPLDTIAQASGRHDATAADVQRTERRWCSSCEEAPDAS